MANEKFVRLRDWVEPAHPVLVERYDDLIDIYRFIRGKFQEPLDQAFDRVARQIGYVITTTVPVVMEIGEKGVIKSVRVKAENLRGTLFESIVEAISTKEPIPRAVRPGNYTLYLLWYGALKLKLRADWVEPAHFLRERSVDIAQAQQVSQAAEVRWEVREPAHWFDPGIALADDEAVLITAIDEVYPEIRLASRVAAYRELLRRAVRPEVMEPAHFRNIQEM